MSKEDAVKRTRVQLMRIIESEQVEAHHRVQAAAVLLKGLRTGQEDTRVKGVLKGVFRALADA